LELGIMKLDCWSWDSCSIDNNYEYS